MADLLLMLWKRKLKCINGNNLNSVFMRSSILLLAVVVFFSSPVFSQKLRSMGGGGLTIGYGYLDVSGIHRFTPGAPSFSNSQLLIGGEGHGIIGNFVIGGSGQGIIGNTVRTDSLEVSLGGGMGTFDFGYLLVSKDKLKLFPMLGLGSSGYGINISKNRNVSLGSIAEDPGLEIKIHKSSFVMDLSINLNFIPQLTENKEDSDMGGLMIGFKTGAVVSPKSSTWSFAGGDVTGGPGFGVNMIYLKVIVGGFGGRKAE
jgi:hypothetical protein